MNTDPHIRRIRHSNAQFAFSHYTVKGPSGFGGGGLLDLGIPINNGDIIMALEWAIFSKSSLPMVSK